MATESSASQAAPRRITAADGVNYLNIGLMILSAVLAESWPFALFLFSYAVLGPLHYLTEISWLHDRKYFTRGRHDYLILGLLCLLTVIPGLGVIPVSAKATVIVTYLSFAAAGIFAFTSAWRERARLMVFASVFVPVILGQGLLLVIFGVLLPTIVHVFLFTGMFILAGTLRQKSVSGVLSLAAFVGIALGLILWHPAFAGHPMPGDYVRRAYGEASKNNYGRFLQVNFALVRLLAPHSFPSAETAIQGVNAFLYGHPVARSVMAFIAFSYTYHYLNWFSKTSVIGWHKVPKGRLTVVMAIWCASLGLYAADYQLGASWLYFLSFLHVVLELPLNHLTMRGIVAALKTPRAAPA